MKASFKKSCQQKRLTWNCHKSSHWMEFMKESLKRWVLLSKTLPIEQMSADRSQLFLEATLAEKNRGLLPQDFIQDAYVKLMTKRAEKIGLTISDYVKVFLLQICDTPGSIVIYLALLRSYGKVATMNDISFVFPNGFLTRDSMEKLWEAQCINGTNMIDNLSEEDYGV